MLPSLFVQVLTQIVSFVSYNLEIPLPFLKIEKNHFGTILLTNVTAMKGYHDAFGPITNFTRTMATVVMCTPMDRPVAVNGEVKIAKMMNVNVTFDHRFLDGSQGAKMYDSITDVFENPAKYF